MHMWPIFECSIIFGVLKADVDELPKDTSEFTTGTLRESDFMAPICWHRVLPRLNKGIRVERNGMVDVHYVIDDQGNVDSMDLD